MRVMRNAYNILVTQLEEKRPIGDLGVYEKIILKWILKKGYVNWIHLAQDRF
jgi:hypothetical protein